MPSGIYKRSPELIDKITKRVLSIPKFEKHTEESKNKIRIARIDRKKKLGYINSPETIEKIRKTLYGSKRHTKKHTLESRLMMSLKHRGENHPNWKGGISSINESIRSSFEYRLWRESVFRRDNFRCVWCGSKKRIESDHIKPFAYYPELRFAIDNGRTLCHECHKTTETYGRGKKNKQRSS